MSATEDRETTSQHVLQLLAEGRAREAKESLEQTMGDEIVALEKRLSRLKQEYALLSQLTQLRLHITGEVQAGQRAFAIGAGQSPLILGDGTDSPEDVRNSIFAVCRELAQQNDGMLSLQEAVDEVKKRGIELKSSRPGTSIGNMLFKSAEWDRIGDGVFQWNGYKK